MTRWVPNNLLQGIQFPQKRGCMSHLDEVASEKFGNSFVGQYKSWNLAVLKLTGDLGALATETLMFSLHNK